MAMRLGALHDALLQPGNPELAQKAAEELAGYDNRFAAIESDLTLLKWMVGTIIALALLILGKVW